MAKNEKKSSEYSTNMVVDEEVADTAGLESDELTASDAKSSVRQPNLVEGKNRWWLNYLITAVVLLVFAALLAWSENVFTATNTKELLGGLSTAFFVPGILSVGFGALVVCSNAGAFDMLAYGFQTLFRIFKKDPIDRKYRDYYGYRQAMKEKKRSFWYLIIVGAVFVLIGGVFLIIFNAV